MTIGEAYNKYESRLQECNEKWSETLAKIKADTNTTNDALVEELSALNVQIGVYECIVKDLKEIIDETC